MSDRIIIVSRHPAAVEFIARQLGGDTDWYWQSGAWTSDVHEVAGLTAEFGPPSRVVVNVVPSFPGATDGRISVLASASPDDVLGMVVYGTLPLHLACLAREVVAIEFAGAPPRGVEYTLADMVAAGARLVRYAVRAAAEAVVPEDATP